MTERLIQCVDCGWNVGMIRDVKLMKGLVMS